MLILSDLPVSSMADSSFLSYLNLNEKNKRKSFEEATIMEILCSISEVIAFLGECDTDSSDNVLNS